MAGECYLALRRASYKERAGELSHLTVNHRHRQADVLPSSTPTLFSTTHSTSDSQPLVLLPSRKHWSRAGCCSIRTKMDNAWITLDWWTWLCRNTSNQSKPTTRCMSSLNLPIQTTNQSDLA